MQEARDGEDEGKGGRRKSGGGEDESKEGKKKGGGGEGESKGGRVEEERVRGMERMRV